MTFFFVLDEQRRVVSATQQEWETFPEEELMVAETRLPAATVTTFFDGEAEHGEDAPPRTFATISQIERSWREEARYASWEEAESGHERIVSRYLEGFSGTFG